MLIILIVRSSVPDDFLSDYSKAIQTDGYYGYNKLSKKEGVTRYDCWAHVRRKFIYAEDESNYDKIAKEFISHIRHLYIIEKESFYF